MKDKLRTPLLDHYQSLKQPIMTKRKMYCIELTRSHTLAQEIAIMACLSNGSGKYISLQDMESIVKVEVIRYPATNDYITATRTGDTLTIDAKDINILTITEVEIMELDKPQLSNEEAKAIIGVPTIDQYAKKGIADENNKELLN
jgi:hypothetical protein